MAKRITTAIFLDRVRNKNPEMFSRYDYHLTKYESLNKKVVVICVDHGKFEVWPGDHMRGMSGCKQCISEKRKQTNIKKYGVDNYFKRVDLIQSAMIVKHGVKNPGLMENHVEKIIQTNLDKFGITWGHLTPSATFSRKKTNLEKYGVEYPMMNCDVAKRAVNAKIQKGGFTKANSSQEATKFIRSYVNSKGYDLSQCAFADDDNGLFEWGIYINNRWVLYDLVVFEKGHRGDKSKIIEILEYHGPFHYTLNEVTSRGNEKAYPWKSNKTTIKESYERDCEKENIGKTLTDTYTVIRTRKDSEQEKQN